MFSWQRQPFWIVETFGHLYTSTFREMQNEIWKQIRKKWKTIRIQASFGRLNKLVEQELPTLPEHLSSPPVVSGIRLTGSLMLCVMLCRSLFVLFSFFFWSLCLSFFGLWILITALISSNCSISNNSQLPFQLMLWKYFICKIISKR